MEYFIRHKKCFEAGTQDATSNKDGIVLSNFKLNTEKASWTTKYETNFNYIRNKKVCTADLFSKESFLSFFILYIYKKRRKIKKYC